MADTTNLKLPFLSAQQAQKHVTHNEALAGLDRLVQLAVLDRHLSAPPAAPTEGARYIVAAGPTGAWTGKAGQIAAWSDGAWLFHAPNEGWLAWVADEDVILAFDGGNWTAPSMATTALLGINATADATNRLSVSSTASLFNHAGNGHQIKLNKAAVGDTASLLMQTGFSGRAEMGLTGDDDFRIKVTANGSLWRDAIRLDRTSGRALFPSGGVREQLAANRSYFVAATGLDSNDGLSIGSPFATPQRALDIVAALDLGGFDVTIQIGDGTYAGGVILRGPIPGTGTVTLKGNGAAPQNVILSRSGADAVTIRSGLLRLEALTIQTSGAAAHGLTAESGAIAVLGPGLRFGACGGNQVNALSRALVRFETGASVAITGGALAHLSAASAQIEASGNSWTLTGTPVFTQFASASRNGTINLATPAFTGAATGARYSASQNGVINTGTGNATLLPGSAAGSVATGGVYG